MTARRPRRPDAGTVLKPWNAAKPLRVENRQWANERTRHRLLCARWPNERTGRRLRCARWTNERTGHRLRCARWTNGRTGRRLRCAQWPNERTGRRLGCARSRIRSAQGAGSVVRVPESEAHRAQAPLCAFLNPKRTGRRLRCAQWANERTVKTAVILPAAGLGTRMQRGVAPNAAEITGTSRKQFMLLEGAPILVHTVRKFVASPS